MMHLTRIFEGRSRLCIIAAACYLLLAIGCGGGMKDTSVNATTPSNNSTGNSANPSAVANNQAAVPSISARANPTASDARENNSKPTSNIPNPQIGTGGNDFFLFTQTRAALDADPDLRTANITVDVKAGVLTLNGTVANASQKSKAEQLVRRVDGVKDVRNRLRASS